MKLKSSYLRFVLLMIRIYRVSQKNIPHLNPECLKKTMHVIRMVLVSSDSVFHGNFYV